MVLEAIAGIVGGCETVGRFGCWIYPMLLRNFLLYMLSRKSLDMLHTIVPWVKTNKFYNMNMGLDNMFYIHLYVFLQ